jgi:outer membrane protein insertion porin family
MLTLMPALALAQQPYYGTTATSVQLSAEADPLDTDKLQIRAGDMISPQNVRAGIQALFDTGRYRTIEVDAVPVQGGTQITFNVTPHYFFSTFTLEPAKALDRPLSSLIRLPIGQKVSEVRLKEVVEQTIQTLKDAGYFNATVTATLGPDNTNRLRTVDLRANVRGPEDRATVTSIQLQGGEGVVPASQLLDKFDVSAGDVFSANAIEKGLAAIREYLLEQSFLNSEVRSVTQYDAANNTASLMLTVGPGQKTVIDTGQRIPDSEVRKLIPVFEEGEFDEDLIREGRARIVEYEQQQGYFEVRVEGPVIVQATAGNPLRVGFTIDQGERHKVRSVRFQGNTVFTDEQLRERIKVRAAGFPKFLTHGLFSEQLAQADVLTIQSMYRREGYEAAFIEYRPEEGADHQIDVTFDITENTRNLIESLVISGNREIPESDLRSIIGIKTGDFYSPSQAANARNALMAHYYEMGFPDVRVDATADPNPQTLGRRLTYQISEGPRYRVGELLVTGNTRTNVTLIKRASRLKEYDYFNPEDILQAQQRLYSTGLFSRVDVVPLDRNSGELRPILIQVEEAKSIVVTPGVGIKERAGPRATLDISHNNILGGGRSLGLRFRWGVNEQQVQSTYREPRLFNHESLDGFVNLTAEKTDQPTFQARSLEFALQVRKRIGQTDSFLTNASYQIVDLENLKVSDVVRKSPDLKGVIRISKFGTSYISDRRDDAVDPKNGKFNTTAFQIAGKAWGSEVNFVSIAHQSSFFRPKGIGILALSSRVGWKLPYGGDDELPITERYFAGGSTTLRGFGLDEAGPPGGGQLLTLANAEYRVPLKKLSIGELRGALFYDTGNVFETPSDFSLKDFTHTAGVGIRFQTPLGPVRFDVGFNLNPRNRLDADGRPVREDSAKAFFTLGHAF